MSEPPFQQHLASFPGPDDPAPFSVFNESGKARCLLVCDHAGHAVPARLGDMGLQPEDFGKHWAVDIGAGDVARHLADMLDAPLVLNNYSRVVVDTNRSTDHPTTFPVSGEGTPIPGNADLSAADRLLRLQGLYVPFHRKIQEILDAFLARGVIPAVLSIHSFTPVFFDQPRPWQFGVLWVQDSRLPLPLIESFRAQGYVVGDNQPYDARDLRGSTIGYHADARRLPNALIEIRNDLLTTPGDRREIAMACHEGLEKILADETLYTYYDGPQNRFDPEREWLRFREMMDKTIRGEGYE